MSDGITDAYREEEKARLADVSPHLIADHARRCKEDLKIAIKDLRTLGYTVEDKEDKLKIFKEI